MARFVVLIVVGLAGCEVGAGDDVDVSTGGDTRDAVSETTAPDATETDVSDETIADDIAGDVPDPIDTSDAPDPIDTSDTIDATDSADTTPPRDFGPPVPSELAASLQAVLDDHFAAANAAGVTIGVRLPDGSWWEGATGEACFEPERAVVVGDRFRLGSVTKTWVAAAVLQLVDEGVIDLDEPIDDVVTGFDLGDDITVRRCLDHTTGIFDPSDDPLSVHEDFSQPIDPREIVRLALEHERLFVAGTAWKYSNTNYFLLGLLIQEVTGERIAQVLRERFLDPLALLDTFLEDAEPATTTFVCGNVDTFDVTDLLDMSWTWAAGAMVSSTGDMCRWADALWRGDVLPIDLRTAMMSATPLPGDATANYGFGTQLRTRGGLPVVGHNGQTLGFQSELFIDPASGLCVAVLANDFNATPEGIGNPAWDVLVPYLGLR